jgi:hypothetical protein
MLTGVLDVRQSAANSFTTRVVQKAKEVTHGSQEEGSEEASEEGHQEEEVVVVVFFE